MVSIVTRSNTVSASLDADGKASVEAHSGAKLALAAMARDEGMTPLELMDAALAGCLVLSVRIAARKFGWHERLAGVKVDVTHIKAEDAPSRVGEFTCEFQIDGDFSAAERQQLIDESHVLCTVGNTFTSSPTISDIEAK